MLLLETVRQTGLALSHFGFGVTSDQRSVMRDVGFQLDPRVEPRGLLSATNVAISVECQDVIKRGPVLRGMTVSLRLAADGIEFGTGFGAIRWISETTYAALRARSGSRLDWDQLRWSSAAPPRLPTPTRAASDALLASASTGLELRRLVMPLDHPVYFDHTLDHAPGMLLIDAAWQAVLELRGGGRLVGCTMDCPAFTELGIDTDLRLLPISDDTVGFSVEQQGKVTASGTLNVSDWGDSHRLVGTGSAQTGCAQTGSGSAN
jgi:hypothetical protein